MPCCRHEAPVADETHARTQVYGQTDAKAGELFRYTANERHVARIQPTIELGTSTCKNLYQGYWGVVITAGRTLLPLLIRHQDIKYDYGVYRGLHRGLRSVQSLRYSCMVIRKADPTAPPTQLTTHREIPIDVRLRILNQSRPEAELLEQIIGLIRPWRQTITESTPAARRGEGGDLKELIWTARHQSGHMQRERRKTR